MELFTQSNRQFRILQFYHSIILSLLICCVATQRSALDPTAQFFPTGDTNIEIQNIEYDGLETLYVGTTNQVLQLNVSSLRVKDLFETGPRSDSSNCQNDRCGEQNSAKVDNANIFLMLDSTNQQLIACGNVGLGSCFSLKSNNVSDLIKESDPVQLEHVIRSSTEIRCKGITYPDDKGSNVFIVACDAPSVVSKAPTQIDFLFSVRDLTPTNRLLSTHYFSSSHQKWSFFKPINMDEKKIKIVNVFTVGMFVYIVETGFLKLDSPDVESTRIGRYSRQDSQLLLTYSEIPLTCKDSSGTEYLVASAVTLVREPPPGLKSRLGTPISGRSEILMGVFRKPTDKGASALGYEPSIVCGFSISEIDEMFRKVITNCFQGIGQQGMGGGLLSPCEKYFDDTLTEEMILVKPYESADATKLNMLSSYPENVMGKVPDDLVTGTEIMVYKDELLTGISVMAVDDFANILLTTGQGKLKKVSFKQTNQAPNQYYEAAIFTGQRPSISSDIIFNTAKNFAVFFSESQLVKMPIHNCEAHTSCDTCVSAGGPYCGWCTLQDKCTDQKGCRSLSRGDENAWIRYEEKCIAIKEVTPQMVSMHYTEPTDHRTIRLTVTRLPRTAGDERGMIYFCNFGGGQDFNGKDRTRFTLELGSTERGSCSVPIASNFLKEVPTGQAFITVTLSIVTEVGGRYLNLTSRQVKFYDCAALSNCIECTSSRFECDWCLSSGKCVNSQLAGDVSAITDSCLIQQRIIGEHSSTAVEVGMKKGQDFCPQVGYPTASRNIQSFHVGKSKTQFELSFRNIPEVSHSSGSDNTLVCVVQQQPPNSDSAQNSNQNPYVRREIPNNSPMIQKIEAFASEGFRDRISCRAPNGLQIEGSESSVNATVTLQWGHNGLIADNPDKFTIELYNCQKLAGNCGECLSYVDEKFDCGFCQAPLKGFCTIESQCDHTFITNNAENVCLNPRIHSFEPKSGPLTGNTLINITGENLGRSIENIARIYIKTKSEQIQCDIVPQYYMPAKSVVCRTTHIAKDTEGSIVVEITHDKSFEVQSDVKFRYRSPYIADFNPKIGPLDGGTRVIVNGSNLDAGSNIEVSVAGYNCDVIERWTKWFICVTNPAKRIGDTDRVKILVDQLYNQKSAASFVYKPNPTIVKLEPDSTIEIGGILVNVSGNNLDVVKFPKIQLVPSTSRDEVASVYAGATGACEIVSSRLMTCEMPKISRAFYEHQNGYRQRRDANDAFLFPTRVGFIMDGVKFQPEDFFPVSVYRNPEFSSKNATPEGILILQSRYDIPEFVYHQTNISIDGKECRKSNFNNDREIRCSMDPEIMGKSGMVRVMVGTSFSQDFHISGTVDPRINIGPLSVRKDDVIYLLTILACVMMVFIICIMVCSCYYCRHQKVTYFKEKKKFFNQIEKLQEDISHDSRRLLISRPEFDDSPNNLTLPPVNDFRQYIENILFRDADANFLSPFTGTYELMHDRYSPLSQQQSSEIATLVDNIEYWLSDRVFLVSIMEVLENSHQCSAQSRSQFVTLLMVAFMSRMTYITSVMGDMVSTLINDAYRMKRPPESLFRRPDSMAEKLVFNWLVFTMYSDLKKENISKALYELFTLVKGVTEEGPVDQVTGRSFFTLNLDNRLVKCLELSDEKMNVMYQDSNHNFRLDVPVYDSITQLKEKILDYIYRSTPYSKTKRAKAHDYVLVVRSLVSHLEEVKEEYTDATKQQRRVRKLLTVKDILPRDTSTYVVYLKPNQFRESNVDAVAAAQVPPSKTGTLDPSFRQPATPLLKMKEAWSTLRFPKSGAYNDYMMTNGASNNGYCTIMTQDTPELLHLEHPDENNHYNFTMDTDEFHSATGGRGANSKKEMKTREKQQAKVLKNLSQSRDLNRIMLTREYTKDAVEKLFKEILYYEQNDCVPFAIAYLFKLFNQCAEENRNFHHLKLWKSNCFISEFWSRLIQKPDNLLDIRSVTAVEHSLEIVAQTLVDAEAYDRNRLMKSNQLANESLQKQPNIFEKYLPDYKEIVAEFFRKLDSNRMSKDELLRERLSSPRPIFEHHMSAFLEDITTSNCRDELDQQYQQQQQHQQSIYAPHYQQHYQHQQYLSGSPPSSQQSPHFHPHLGATAASSPNPTRWDTLYKVNALKMIYDRFLVPQATEIIDTIRLMGPSNGRDDGALKIDEELFQTFVAHFSPESGHSYSTSS
ncbi:plexin-A4-like isoform X3 [Convolutriloba macropyga]|uniref:plexin-A4-like isoform X3 n=1 Tax=Convolutriloba macropyga TaxID=536237 RepID=UPI003F52548C